MLLGRRVADAAHELQHAVGGDAGQAPHGVDRGEQRRAPRRDADDVAAGERRLQVAGRRHAEVADDALLGVVEAVDDHGLAEPVRRLQGLLEMRLHALGSDDGGPDDPLGLRLLEEPGDARLGDVQAVGDLGLEHALLVI